MKRTASMFVILSVALAGCLEAQQIPGPGAETESVDPAATGRVVAGLQVLYTFDEGEGLVVKDRSGVEPAFDLQLDNLVTQTWIAGGGIDIVGTSVITSPEVAEKVFVACVEANAVTLEAWIEPANTTQQGTVFTYSKQGERNARLSVNATRYSGQVRTARPDPMVAGEIIETIETVQTPENMAAPAVQHVVYTRDVSGAAVYLDGVDTKPPSTEPMTEPAPVTDQSEWSPTYQLALGNESTGGSPWLGKIYMAAIYCSKLSPADVQTNYSAGY